MNPPPKPSEATRLLQAWSGGSPEALDQLMPLVYDEMRRHARDYLRRERADHTPVHEAYLRLRRRGRGPLAGPRALLRHRRTHHAPDPGAACAPTPSRQARGHQEHVALDTVALPAVQKEADFVELDDLLRLFADTYPRKAEVVELKFFGGLEAREIAEVLQTNEKTVLRDKLAPPHE